MLRELSLYDILLSCIVRGSFTLHSGQPSSWKFVVENMADDLMLWCLKELNMPQDAMPVGIPTGGQTLVEHLQFYALMSDFEDRGPMPTRVCLVDDVVTTGATMNAAKLLIEAAGVVVVDKVCILNRSLDYSCRSILIGADVVNFLGQQ